MESMRKRSNERGKRNRSRTNTKLDNIEETERKIVIKDLF